MRAALSNHVYPHRLVLGVRARDEETSQTFDTLPSKVYYSSGHEGAALRQRMRPPSRGGSGMR
jgi:hypothetical protein